MDVKGNPGCAGLRCCYGTVAGKHKAGWGGKEKGYVG